MKKIIALMLFLVLSFTSFAFARTVEEGVDIGKITCKGFFKLNEKDQMALIFWVDGYLGSFNKTPMFDPTDLEKIGEFINKSCKKKSKKLILDIILELSEFDRSNKAEDLSHMKCADFAKLKSEQATPYVCWIGGYMAAQIHKSIINGDSLNRIGMSIDRYCLMNPDKTLLQAIENFSE